VIMTKLRNTFLSLSLLVNACVKDGTIYLHDGLIRHKTTHYVDSYTVEACFEPANPWELSMTDVPPKVDVRMELLNSYSKSRMEPGFTFSGEININFKPREKDGNKVKSWILCNTYNYAEAYIFKK